MDYGCRTASNDVYKRAEHRSPSPSLLATLSIRGDPYADAYQANGYGSHSERYDLLRK